jgi:hypothetical protein
VPWQEPTLAAARAVCACRYRRRPTPGPKRWSWPRRRSRPGSPRAVRGPVASTYWWNDEIERAEEWFVFFKLPADRYEALAAFLAERHSYDEPEIVATPFVAGSPSFLSWITEEARPRDVPRPRGPETSGLPEPQR